MTYIIHLVFSYLNIVHLLTCQVLFFWSDTSEGYFYWDKVDDDWRELVDEYGW